MQPLGATTASMPNFYYIDLNKKKGLDEEFEL